MTTTLSNLVNDREHLYTENDLRSFTTKRLIEICDNRGCKAADKRSKESLILAIKNSYSYKSSYRETTYEKLKVGNVIFVDGDFWKILNIKFKNTIKDEPDILDFEIKNVFSGFEKTFIAHKLSRATLILVEFNEVEELTIPGKSSIKPGLRVILYNSVFTIEKIIQRSDIFKYTIKTSGRSYKYEEFSREFKLVESEEEIFNLSDHRFTLIINELKWTLEFNENERMLKCPLISRTRKVAITAYRKKSDDKTYSWKLGKAHGLDYSVDLDEIPEFVNALQTVKTISGFLTIDCTPYEFWGFCQDFFDDNIVEYKNLGE